MKTLLAVLALAGTISWTDAAVNLSGAASLEEIPANELERFCSLHENPIQINRAGRSRLIASGLFSQYQVASLLDYIENNGDILSLSELSLVNGFSAEYADNLNPFIALDGHMNGRQYRRLDAEVNLKYSAPEAFGVKSRFTLDDRFEVDAGNKSWAAAYYGVKHIGKVVAGDLSARFGQGLLLWNGFSISGFGSISSFRRNASGISSCMSYTDEGHIRGIGGDLIFGKWNLSTLCSFQSGEFSRFIPQTAAVNINRTGKSSTIGASCMLSGSNLNASIDFKFGLPDLSIFGEAGYAYGTPQAIAGLIWNPGYKLEFAARGEWTDRLDIAAGARWNWFFASGEYYVRSWKRSTVPELPVLKTRMNLTPEFRAGKNLLKPSLQWQFKRSDSYESGARNDIRIDLEIIRGQMMLHARYNFVKCIEPAWITYIETGYKDNRMSVYLRGGMFKADNWDDRIYVYERDIPGSYNSPARYGRGIWSALCAGWKFRAFKLRHSLGLRLAGTWYAPYLGKSPKYECKIQYSMKL